MLLDEENIKALKKYLIRHLEPICDAEPPVLANYIIALLRNDKTRSELRDSCIEQLEDFLKDDTRPFVNRLFDVLKDVEAKPGHVVVSVPSSSPLPLSASVDNELDQDAERDHKHARRGSPEHEEARKRRSSPEEDRYNGSFAQDENPSKRRKDEEESSGDEERHHRRVSERDRHEYDRSGHRHSRSRYEAYDRRERHFEESPASSDMQGNAIPSFSESRRPKTGRIERGGRFNPPFRQQQRRARPRCRDYDERGFCMRGELCPYDHGDDRIIVPDLQEFRKLNMVPDAIPAAPALLPPPFPIPKPDVEMFASQSKRDPNAYDPELATYNPENPMFSAFKPMGGQPLPLGAGPWPIGPMLGPGPGRGMERGRAGRARFWGRGNERGGFRARGRVFNPDFVGDLDLNLPPGIESPGANEEILLNPRPLVFNNGQLGGIFPSQADKKPTGQDNQPESDEGRESMRGDYRLGQFNKRRRFDPNFKEKDTLMIANIPPELNNIEKLNSHFKKFGTVVNIQVKFHANKAFVQFKNHYEAANAIKCVEAVLGNRFVKVLWSSRGEDLETGAKPEEKQPKVEPKEIKPHPAPMQPPVETTEQKKEKILALQKRKEEMRLQQIGQHKQLVEKMDKKLKEGNLDPKEKADLIASIKTLTNTLTSTLKKDTVMAQSQTAVKSPAKPAGGIKVFTQQKERELLDRELDMLSLPKDKNSSSSTTPTQSPSLKARPLKLSTDSSKASTLAHLEFLKNKLEQQAASLGLDTSSIRGGRGAFRARGRASGVRGRGRGRGNTLVLDNRPTTLSVMNLPESLKDESALRGHFQGFGDVATITVQRADQHGPDRALVRFANRRSAENSLASGRMFNNQPLQMSWYLPSKVSSSAPLASDTGDGDSRKVPFKDDESVEETEMYTATGQFEEEEEEEEERGERSWKH